MKLKYNDQVLYKKKLLKNFLNKQSLRNPVYIVTLSGLLKKNFNRYFLQ